MTKANACRTAEYSARMRAEGHAQLIMCGIAEDLILEKRVDAAQAVACGHCGISDNDGKPWCVGIHGGCLREFDV